MPQLNPNPWFLLSIMAWLIFLLFLPTKVIAHNYPYPPSFHNTYKLDYRNWSWPWQ